jgi:citrate synthase
MGQSSGEWLSSAEVCDLLGVRPQTLYAYVSRGILTPQRDGRRSYFRVDELERLEPRRKRVPRPGRIDVSIDSAVTFLDPDGHLFFRGESIAKLASNWSFERVAELLWTGEDAGDPRPWPVPANNIPAVGRTLADRLHSAMSVLAATAPDVDSRPEAATTIGRRALPQLLTGLPVVSSRPDKNRTEFANQLWPRLSALAPERPRLRALNGALNILADHELVRSTIAARMAASSQAPPLNAVLAGMATHAGVGRYGFRTSMEQALRAGSEPPGAYDHVAYTGRDPRADTLIPLIDAAASRRGWRLVERVLNNDRSPNADLAVAALCVACEMLPGAAEAIYTIARAAGLLAHIAEEYEHPTAFHPRVGYRGRDPQAHG